MKVRDDGAVFEVVDQVAGTSSLYLTRAAALAAARSLAHSLAERLGLGDLVEETCSCDTLICGTILDDAGDAINLEPLVWIDPNYTRTAETVSFPSLSSTRPLSAS